MDNQLTTFYIELDAILDTRLGTLMRLNPEQAIFASGSKQYVKRFTDDFRVLFDDFDKKLYDELYAERNKSTLFYSRRTEIIDFLRLQLYSNAILKASGDPRIGRLNVVVNYFPYNLDGEDIAIFKRNISILLEQDEKYITFEYRPYKDMTLKWLRELEPAAMFIYNFSQWLEECGDFPRDDKECGLIFGSPETQLFAPGLLTDKNSLEKFHEVDKTDLTVKDPFSIITKSLAPLFSFQVLPVKLFSCVHLTLEENLMVDLNKVIADITVMNNIAGNTKSDDVSKLVTQSSLIAEEFCETMEGLLKGMSKGDWNDFRNGLGDMSVVIWGNQAISSIPMDKDLAIIMEKNMSKFDTDFATATQSLNANQEKGYKCEIKEVEIDGQKYFPIVTTEDGVVILESGEKKPYFAGKFLKSIHWTEEDLEPVTDLPEAENTTDVDYALLDKVLTGSIEKLLELQKSLRRDFMKSS